MKQRDLFDQVEQAAANPSGAEPTERAVMLATAEAMIDHHAKGRQRVVGFSPTRGGWQNSGIILPGGTGWTFSTSDSPAEARTVLLGDIVEPGPHPELELTARQAANMAGRLVKYRKFDSPLLLALQDYLKGKGA